MSMNFGGVNFSFQILILLAYFLGPCVSGTELGRRHVKWTELIRKKERY